MTRTLARLQAFTLGYAEAMLWANTYGVANGELDESADIGPYMWQTPSDAWQIEAFDQASQEAIEGDCHDFFAANLRDLMAYADVRSYADAGHDFALTRNGHGAGFWDRGLGELGDRLTDAAKAYGSQDAWCDSSDSPSDYDAHIN